MIETDTQELTAEILAEVAAERRTAWTDARTKHNTEKGAKLADDPNPPPEHMPWLAEKVIERRGPRIERLKKACFRSQLGDAELLMDRVGDRYAFDHKRKIWMSFEKTHWEPDSINEIRAEVVKLAEHFDRAAVQAKADENKAESKPEAAAAAKKDHKLFSERAKQLRGDRRISGILSMASSGRDSMGISGDSWDQHPTLLACGNGVVDLATGKLYPGDPKLFIRKASPIDFPGLHATSPFWEDFVQKVMCHDAAMVDYLERLIGYAATGLVSHKEIYVAKGPTANNGKSSFFDTVQRVMGDAAGTIKKEVLLQKKNAGSGADPDLLMLDGLRMAIASEPDQGTKFDKEAIKVLTGGDEITTRGLYMDNITFKPICKLFLHTNFMPQVAKADQAFFNRMRILPFEAQFTGKANEVDEARNIYKGKPRTVVDRQLTKDAPAILAWIVRCARKYLTDEALKYPLRVAEEIEQYQDDMDEIGRWVAEWCLVDKNDASYKEQAKDLYSSFRTFCVHVLEKPDNFILTQRTFGEQLQQRFEKKKTNKVYYHGIKVRPECRSEAPQWNTAQ